MPFEPLKASGLASWNPATDTSLFHAYTIKDLAEKRTNKEAFQKLVGLHVNRKALLVSVIPPFTNMQGMEHITHILPGIMQSGSQLVVAGGAHATGYEHVVHEMRQYHGLAVAAHDDERTLHRVLAASDVLLFPAHSHPEGTPQQIALRYGTVPITEIGDDAHGVLNDYDPRTEAGNAFFYIPGSPWSMFACIVRAVETFKLPFDWRSIQKNGMELSGVVLPEDDSDSIETL